MVAGPGRAGPTRRGHAGEPLESMIVVPGRLGLGRMCLAPAGAMAGPATRASGKRRRGKQRVGGRNGMVTCRVTVKTLPKRSRAGPKQRGRERGDVAEEGGLHRRLDWSMAAESQRLQPAQWEPAQSRWATRTEDQRPDSHGTPVLGVFAVLAGGNDGRNSNLICSLRVTGGGRVVRLARVA